MQDGIYMYTVYIYIRYKSVDNHFPNRGHGKMLVLLVREAKAGSLQENLATSLIHSDVFYCL